MDSDNRPIPPFESDGGMMNVEQMTKKDFLKLPFAKWDEEYEFDSLIIIPGNYRDIHDSGYRNMTFVAVKGNQPLFLLGGCSDVLHIGGISGLGHNWMDVYKTCPKLVPPIMWSIDCLKKSGLLRLFTGRGLISGIGLSSFEIFGSLTTGGKNE